MKSLKILFFLISFAYSFSAIGQTVYKTKTGEKYHKESCNYLKYSKFAITLEDALAYGYEACKVCKPLYKTSKTALSSSNAKADNNNTESKVSNASQCTGKTKAGKRCKRMTKNANGRCYQH